MIINACVVFRERFIDFSGCLGLPAEISACISSSVGSTPGYSANQVAPPCASFRISISFIMVSII
jgi:hypothetical protein